VYVLILNVLLVFRNLEIADDVMIITELTLYISY